MQELNLIHVGLSCLMVFHDSGINMNFYRGVMVMGALEALPTQGCLGTAPLIHLLPLAPVLWSGPGSSGLIPDLRTSVLLGELGSLARSAGNDEFIPAPDPGMAARAVRELGAAVVSNLAS